MNERVGRAEPIRNAGVTISVVEIKVRDFQLDTCFCECVSCKLFDMCNFSFGFNSPDVIL